MSSLTYFSFATSLVAVCLVSQYSLLSTFFIFLSHFFFVNFFLWVLSSTSSFHHQVFLSSCLLSRVPLNIFLAVSLTTSLELYFPSHLVILPFNSSFFLKSVQYSLLFNSHHLILGPAFTHFLFLIFKFILQNQSFFFWKDICRYWHWIHIHLHKNHGNCNCAIILNSHSSVTEQLFFKYESNYSSPTDN